MARKTALFWSGGKDSALALHNLQNDPAVSVDALITTFTEPLQRVTMHGVRQRVIEEQATLANLPLSSFAISEKASNKEYEQKLEQHLDLMSADGFQAVAFGDIFLDDLRKYREGLVAKCSLESQFPLWGKDTGTLVKEFIRYGFKAKIVALDPDKLPVEYLGTELDEPFIDALPDDVDSCGEYGEYHTFVYDAPFFQRPLSIEVGEVVQKKYGEQEFAFVEIDLKR